MGDMMTQYGRNLLFGIKAIEFMPPATADRYTIKMARTDWATVHIEYADGRRGEWYIEHVDGRWQKSDIACHTNVATAGKSNAD
jgi:hypothetical protein